MIKQKISFRQQEYHFAACVASLEMYNTSLHSEQVLTGVKQYK